MSTTNITSYTKFYCFTNRQQYKNHEMAHYCILLTVFQNIALRKITNAQPFVSNYTLHKDLTMKTMTEEAVDFYKRFHKRLQTHQNPLIKSLYTQTIPGNPRRRLRRNRCRDFMQVTNIAEKYILYYIIDVKHLMARTHRNEIVFLTAYYMFSSIIIENETFGKLPTTSVLKSKRFEQVFKALPHFFVKEKINFKIKPKFENIAIKVYLDSDHMFRVTIHLDKEYNAYITSLMALTSGFTTKMIIVLFDASAQKISDCSLTIEFSTIKLIRLSIYPVTFLITPRGLHSGHKANVA
ncbi:hypothetical protein AGLY_017773 [Aphis glycines]|uniref:Uncharacterized protein n=1 Tax=Aphis glycines TaxID=307491 RepID=A0A6G0SUL2_APHGL|nr:hypothetical protein AGLY_017773 [Aphis glycines]